MSEIDPERHDVTRVALVTGAGSGIGRASATAFAEANIAVVASDLDAASAEETAQSITRSGGTAIAVSADVTNERDVERLVNRTIEEFGRLDYAHNNAGVGGPPAPTGEYPIDVWHQILAVNLTGTFLCMRHEIPLMLAQGGGAIVNTASTFGVVGTPGMAAYTATKHGIVGLSKGAALEYAQSNIRVNAVCPGAIRTPALEEFFTMLNPEAPEAAADEFAAQEPVGRLGRPEEIAAAVVWLCSDAASFVTGHTMLVDGGWVAR